MHIFAAFAVFATACGVDAWQGKALLPWISTESAMCKLTRRSKVL